MWLLYLPLLPVALFPLGVLASLFNCWRTAKKYGHLPWAGMEGQPWWKLPYFRLVNFFTIKDVYPSAEKKYFLQGQACMIPLALKDVVCLPAADFDWMLQQPDDSLNIHLNSIELSQLDVTLASRYALDHMQYDRVIAKDLTRRVGDLTGDIIDELTLALDELWGRDTSDWKDVNPFTTLIRAIARASNRVFLGPSLSSNKNYIDAAIDFATSVVPTGFLIRIFPHSLRPIFVPLITYKNRVYKRNLLRFLTPIVTARVEETRAGAEKGASPPYNDLLQWSINHVLTSERPQDAEVSNLTDRLLITNFASIHTTTISVVNALFDLVSSPSSQSNIAILRQEADAALATTGGVWTRSSVAQLYNIDSALKESARLSPLTPVGWSRIVVKPGGITAPASGTFVPQGATVGLPAQTMHRDPNIYPDPETYKPLRFAEMRSKMTMQENDGAQTVDGRPGLKASDLAYSATSQSFVTFGHGRHACPGRFFATNELKLLMTYMVQNYDFEILEQRPARQFVGQAAICPMDKTIRVRRREKQ